MIHGDNPFTERPDQRDPVRRFRGRLVAPVTVVTSGREDQARTGLTISSLIVIEGEPGQVQMVVGPTSDLWDLAEKTGAFVVHICHEAHRELAQVFAGLRPNPGGLFSGLEVTQSSYGPVIAQLPNRVFCRFVEKREAGYSGLVVGEIERVEAGDVTDPLVYFRGGYRSLG
ncbi:MAG: flavin reductase family protein [Acidimicrobiia bacterium]|jgi:flavin reductase (DIM6/NTAB) family NADH-FMN oxidoreductase RutF